ncbi:TPA: phage tail protein [Bacillus mycoides]|nr:phage tail protein [Bacillus mycoides]
MKINKSLHVVDFKTNKIVAVFQPQDYWADVRTWELKDNVDYIEFKVFDGTKAAATLMQQNYILRMTRDGKMIPYIIMDECEKDSSDRSITVRAVGAWVSLRGANFIRPQRIESQTAHEFLNLALAGTKFEVGRIDYKSFYTMTIDTFIDPLDFLKRIKNLFELELQYRVEVVASKITGWYVDLIKKRGTYTGKEIRLGKDLNNVIRREHTQNICTALLGYAKTGEGELITVESINNGSPYIVDNEAFQRWSQNGQHIFAIYQPETEEEITPERLMTLMKTEIKKHTDASVQYEVDAADIASIFGLNHEMIGEGDTLRIIDKGFTPALFLEARAIGGKESHTNPETNKYKFGNFVELQNTNDELQKLYNKVLGLLNDKAGKPLLDELEHKLEEQKKELETVKEESEAAMDIAEKVQEMLAGGLVDIFEGPVAPTEGLVDRKTLWLDTSEGLPGILKMWKDGKWEPVVPDVEGMKESILEETSKEINDAKNDLNKEVDSLKEESSKIQGELSDISKEVTDITKEVADVSKGLSDAAKEITDITKEVSDVSKEIENKVDQDWINNELKDKADKSGVYTKEEIKDGFIGKQVYETDKEGNIQKFNDVNTSISQTNEALTQKAEKSELSKTNEGLTQLEKKTTEIETTAEGIKSTVTNVQDSQGKLEKRMTTQEQTTDGFKQSIEKIQTDASKTTEQVNKIEQDVNGTKQSISKIESNVNGLTGNVNNLTKKTTEIETTVNGIKSSVSSVKDSQGKLEKRMTTQEQTADGFKQSITKLQTDAGKTSEQVNKIEQDANGTKQTISKIESNVSGLSGSVNDLTKTTTEIKTEAGKTNQKLTEVAGTVNNLEIGAANLIDGTEFINANGWVKWGNYGEVSIIDQQTLKPLPTRYSLLMQTEVGGKQQVVPINEPVGLNGTGHTFKMKKDQKFTVSMNVATSELGYLLDFIHVMYSDGKGNVKLPVIDTTKFPIVAAISDRLHNNYFRVKFTFTADRDDDNAYLLIAGRTKRALDGTNGYAWIRINALQLEKGTVATDWNTSKDDKVSTTDFTKKTTEIETSVNGIKSSVSNVQDSQGKLEKRVTTQEQTADGFKQSITKLQTDSTKTTERVNKVEQDASGTKQTISKIESDVKGINGSVDSLTKTTTEIKTEAGKTNQKLTEVTSKVDNIKVGGRNLLRDSNKTFNTTDYLINQYTLSENWVTGQEYTFIIKGAVPAGQRLGIWQNGGSNNLGYATTMYVNGVTYVTFKAVTATAGNEKKISLYNYPSNTTQAKVEWVALYVGNKPMDWTAAPEENVSTNDFTKKTTEIETSVKGIKETITKVESNQTNFDKRVTAVEKNAEGITQTVSKVQETQMAQGKQITEAQTTIKQHSEQIALTVKTKDMEDYVGGLGSINEVRNANFEKEFNYWAPNKEQGAAASIDKNLKYKGMNSFLFTTTGLAANKWWGISGEFIPAQVGEEFVASGYFITDGKPPVFDPGTGCFIEVEYWDATKTTRLLTQRTQVNLQNHTWLRFTNVSKAPDKTGLVRFRVYNERNGRFWIAAPMLQRGKVATEFWLHPKDVTDYDKLTDDIAHRVATEDYNKKVTEIQNDIKVNKEGISLSAKKNEVYTKVEADGKYPTQAYVKQMESKIDVNTNNIKLSVKENNVIASINLSKETITLDAKRINLKGYITADHFQAGTIKGVRYESVNAANATNKVVIENSLIKSYGSMDKVAKKQNYASLKEGGLYVYEMAESGSIFGDKEVYVLPGRLNVQGNKWSAAIEPSEFRIWAPGNLATFALGEVPNGTTGYGIRLTAPEGVMVQNTIGTQYPALQFSTDQGIYFDGYGNILGGKFAGNGATWSIKDADGRVKFLTGIGKGSAQTTEMSTYGGGMAFNHNGFRTVAMYRKGEDTMVQIGAEALFKWSNPAWRLEAKSADDGGWRNIAANAFQNASSLVWKTDVHNYEESVIDVIMNTDIMSYRYKSDVEELAEKAPIYLGVISEFAPDIITNEDGSAVNLYDMVSVTWKGIQENYKVLQEKDQEIKVLNDRLYKVESQLQAVLELLGEERES